MPGPQITPVAAGALAFAATFAGKGFAVAFKRWPGAGGRRGNYQFPKNVYSGIRPLPTAGDTGRRCRGWNSPPGGVGAGGTCRFYWGAFVALATGPGAQKSAPITLGLRQICATRSKRHSGINQTNITPITLKS